MSSATARRGRWLRGALVAAIGVGALALPVANYTDHVADPWWGPESPAGDLVLVALSAILVACGAWLARKDWELEYLTTVVVWTYAITASVAVLFAWAIVLQLWVVGEPEPYVLALDGVLIAALVAFASGVITAKHRRDSDVVRRSEAEYRALVEEVIDCSATATIVTDADGSIAWVNRAAVDYFGLDREEAVGTNRATAVDSALEPVGSGERRPAEHCNCDEDPATYHVPPGPDREGRWLERSRTPIGEGLHTGGCIEQYTDVTARHEAAETLGAREEALGQLSAATAAPEAGFQETAERLLDVVREQLGGEYAALSRRDDDGDYRVEVVRTEGGDPTSGAAVPEAHLRCRETLRGAATVHVGSRPFGTDVGGFQFDHGAAATDGGTAAGFETYLGTPVTGWGGERIGTLCLLSRDAATFSDWERTFVELIAQLIGAELERERLYGDGRGARDAPTAEHERERLEFVNRVVRHNVLNGLNLLNARAERLEAVAEEPEAAEHLDVIRNRVEEMTDVVDTVQTFIDAVADGSGHGAEPVPVRSPLVEQVEQAQEHYDATFEVHDLPDPELRVEANELLSEVFANVLSNAVEHNDAAEPAVEVWTTESGDAAVGAAGGGAGHPRTLTVHVADNGPGIREETQRAMQSRSDANLDDPGHGFGFFLVREMVESYGGEVHIRENEPTGAIVELSLPVVEVTDR